MNNTDKNDFGKDVGSRILSVMGDTTQKELADAIGLDKTPNTISYFCKGTRTPNTRQIKQIAKYLNVSADYLLGLTNEPTNNADLKSICSATGLTQKAIAAFVDWNTGMASTEYNSSHWTQYLSNLIIDERFYKIMEYITTYYTFAKQLKKDHIQNNDTLKEDTKNICDSSLFHISRLIVDLVEDKFS